MSSWQDMKIEIVLTENALKDMDRLDKDIAYRILSKLKWFEEQINPLYYTKNLQTNDKKVRFRVGNYRVIGIIEKNKVYITAVGHLREVYK